MTEEAKAPEEAGTAAPAAGEEKPLEKMTATELREVAKTIPGITGAHGMKKEELLAAIREARGIKVEEVKKNLTVLQELKGRIRSLKKEQAAALGAADPVKAARLRRRISQLKKKSRRPAA
ncbi:MAG: Rho termination factor N-terminal domain-containing protein [Thermodesulfobacteriota bacterium]